MCAKKSKNYSKKTSSTSSSSKGGSVKTVSVNKDSGSSQATTRSYGNNVAQEAELPFGKMNYILLLVGVGIIALGFFLMSLDPFIDAKQFSISLYIAPIVVVAGFIEIIYAIMYKPASPAMAQNEEI